MNYIKHLTGFFEKVTADKMLNPTHVSLYMALFQFWNCNRFKNPISISRDEVMRISKISSKATYHKCLKNLHQLGYIHYEPSYNPFKGSHVIMFNFSEELKPTTRNDRKPKNEPPIGQVTKPVLNQFGTSTETSTEQAVVPYINHTNQPNISNSSNVANESMPSKNFEEIADVAIDLVFHQEVEAEKKEKKLRKKKKETSMPFATEQKGGHPTMEQVSAYFMQNNFPVVEAQKFFHYFSSVGWLIGGKTPMVNWQAAAQSWMLNSHSVSPQYTSIPHQRAKQLATTTDKNYAEPL